MPEDDVVVLPAIDDEPDVWVDEHPQATPEEIELGNRLGATIDIDDEDDWHGHLDATVLEVER